MFTALSLVRGRNIQFLRHPEFLLVHSGVGSFQFSHRDFVVCGDARKGVAGGNDYQTGTAGWADNVLYSFHLDYNLNAGEIHVVVKNGDVTLWDSTVVDTTFAAGQFGFYNNSQQFVRYAGFEQTGGVVPEPSTWALALAGLAAMGHALRRRARV